MSSAWDYEANACSKDGKFTAYKQRALPKFKRHPKFLAFYEWTAELYAQKLHNRVDQNLSYV